MEKSMIMILLTISAIIIQALIVFYLFYIKSNFDQKIAELHYNSNLLKVKISKLEVDVVDIKHVSEVQDHTIACLWVKACGYERENPIEEHPMFDRYELSKFLNVKPDFIVDFHSWSELEKFDTVRRNSPLYK